MSGNTKISIADEIKYCPACKKKKSFSEFSKNIRGRGGLCAYCRECNQAKRNSWYRSGKSTDRAYAAKVMAVRKELKRELVESVGGCCVRCGYNKSVAALEFHHTGDNKENTVANLLTKAAGKNGDHFALAIAEAKKCILLCANCHRESHADDYI